MPTETTAGWPLEMGVGASVAFFTVAAHNGKEFPIVDHGLKHRIQVRLGTMHAKELPL
jgi:hypothetical protein